MTDTIPTKEIEISCEGKKKYRVQAKIVGDLAIHNTVGYSRDRCNGLIKSLFTITHILSGVGVADIPLNTLTEEQTIEFARELDERFNFDRLWRRKAFTTKTAMLVSRIEVKHQKRAGFHQFKPVGRLTEYAKSIGMGT